MQRSIPNLRLIMGIDTNAHNCVWGSKDNNKRGNRLLDIINSENLHIENSGNKPTFENKRCNSVIDITLTNDLMNKDIKNWKVINNTLSDHNMIVTEVELKIDINKHIKIRIGTHIVVNWKNYWKRNH